MEDEMTASFRSVSALTAILAGLTGVGIPAGAEAGALKVTSFPTGAQVWVDGANTAKTTPMSISLAEGDHTVTVQIPGSGWQPDTRTVTIAAGNNDLSVTLLPTLTQGPSGPKGDKGDPGPQGPVGTVASLSSLEGIPCTTGDPYDLNGPPLDGAIQVVSIGGDVHLYCTPPLGFRDRFEPNDSRESAFLIPPRFPARVEGADISFTQGLLGNLPTFHEGDFQDWYRMRLLATCYPDDGPMVLIVSAFGVGASRPGVRLHLGDQSAGQLTTPLTCDGEQREIPVDLEVMNPTGHKSAPPNLFYDVRVTFLTRSQ